MGKFIWGSILFLILIGTSIPNNQLQTQFEITESSFNENSIGDNLDFPYEELSSQERKFYDKGIQQYLQNGTFPDNIYDDNILVLSKIALSGINSYIPPVKLGSGYLYFTHAEGIENLRALVNNPSVKSIIPDYKINLNKNTEPSITNPKTESFVSNDILKTSDVWTDFNITGKGVTIGIIDSGVDFGVSDLSSSAKLLSNGYTANFDATGFGLGFANLTVQAINQSGRLKLPLSSNNITIWLSEGRGIDNSANMGIRLEDLDITDIEKPSISGNYKVGIMSEPSLVEGLPSQFFIFVLADTISSGVYDALYIDFETSLGISLARNGIIFESGSNYLNLVEWDLSNNRIPYGPNNPILAKDLDGDGINDVSMGSLGSTYDIFGVISSGENPIVTGIDPSGRGIAVFYDPIGHGTLVASAAAARGQSNLTLFDDKTTSDIENSTIYNLYGSAPQASLIATKGNTLIEFIVGWLWTSGLQLETDIFGNTSWETSDEAKEHLATISSNSWGQGLIANENSLKGQDFYSLFLDFLSTPGSLYADYPGQIFVVAAGNAGPGHGSVSTPGTASMAITVGSSNSYHFKNNNGKNDIAWFSSRGPTPYGAIKPDIVTPGNTGYTHYQVIQGYLNGTLAAGTFGGTSESTPRAAGVIALLIEAMRQKGMEINLGSIRVLLKGSAKDLGFESNAQGAGLVDAYTAVDSIFDGDRIFIKTNESAILVGNRLQSSIGNLFTDSDGNEFIHPLLQYAYDDIVLITDLEALKNTVDLEVIYGNGTEVSSEDYDIKVKRLTRKNSNSFIFDTQLELRSEINLEEIWNLPTDWKDNDYIQISLSLTEDSFLNLVDFGLSMPDITIIDSANGRIITDQITQIAYQQQLYIGNPQQDFIGDPIIQIEDPGVANEISQWEGLFYEGFVQVFSYSIWNDFNIRKNNGLINLNSTSVVDEYQNGVIEISSSKFPSIKSLNPFVIAEEEEVGFGDKAKIVGSDLTDTIPYDLDTYFGSFDWGFRPETGEFRFYRFKLPENATFLAIQGTWDIDGFLPDMYLFDGNGSLVAQSDVTYFGGGFYESTSSEKYAQNLIIPKITEYYTLLVHVARTPFNPLPIQFNLISRYLTVIELPSPEPIFSQNLANPVAGELEIDVSDYSITAFPELYVSGISNQIYQGRNGSLSDTIFPNSFVSGPANSISMIESLEVLQFNQGEKVYLNLNWNGTVDLDMYVFPFGESFIIENDLLVNQGSTPNNITEFANFAVPVTGMYIIYIDYVLGGEDNANIAYTLDWESRDGPTLESNSDSLIIDSRLFPNGEFGFHLVFQTNFGVEFNYYTNSEFLNHVNFTSNIVSPPSGQVSGKITIQWSSNTDVIAYIFVKQGSTSILVENNVKLTSSEIDTTLFSNGPTEIIVELTEGIYTHKYSIQVEFSNSDTITLPPETTSKERSLPFNFGILFMFILGAAKIRSRKTRIFISNN